MCPLPHECNIPVGHFYTNLSSLLHLLETELLDQMQARCSCSLHQKRRHFFLAPRHSTNPFTATSINLKKLPLLPDTLPVPSLITEPGKAAGMICLSCADIYEEEDFRCQ
jgi:hypothetical protein